jgi:UDP-N-acetylmuramate: L-alanyl-gamma-D-glutamyl-meso-diaminopimelate ligase
MRIHFIAIGGAVMHNLAIVLSRQGHTVSGSDDIINDPAKSHLEQEGLLPPKIGFFEENISPQIDVVILGMHARLDNPELLAAQKMGLKIVSFPEFIYEISKNKKRVVIAGSHGKTTITAMVMHVLQQAGVDFDYLVGAKVIGFDTSVKLTENAPLVVLEGDEYLASPIQPESKFIFYRPHLALLSGISWDHINVFPSYQNYVQQFLKFINTIEPNGVLVWCREDAELRNLSQQFRGDLHLRPYGSPSYRIQNGITQLLTENGEVDLAIFGKHNLLNVEGARAICASLGIDSRQFYDAVKSFRGAANRLQLVYKSETKIVFKDFAHSPSKVSATLSAVREQFPDKKIVAVLELHTFSSLNRDFLPQYKGTLDLADFAIVFLDEHALLAKNIKMLDADCIHSSFKKQYLEIAFNQDELRQKLEGLPQTDVCYLFMSSGNFGGLDLSLV